MLKLGGVMKNDISTALFKKAIGYTAKEIVEEYSGEKELLKKKVSTKHIPPDITALKTYLELNKEKDKWRDISDVELQKIKNKLLNQLATMQEDIKNESSRTKGKN